VTGEAHFPKVARRRVSRDNARAVRCNDTFEI
jgi:hypothetical protein